MNKNEIIEYVMYTPGNINKGILEQMLSQLEASNKKEKVITTYSGGLIHTENRQKIEFSRVSEVVLNQTELEHLILTGKFIYRKEDSNYNQLEEKSFVCQVSEKEDWQVKRISNTRLALQVPGKTDEADILLFVVEDWDDSEFNLAPGLYAPSPLDMVCYIGVDPDLAIGGQVSFDFSNI